MTHQEGTASADQSQTNQMTPGQILRRAREELQMTHSDVANKIHLKKQWIVDIENDYFEDASAIVYVRGYVKVYAKLVGVPEQLVVSAFDLLNVEALLARKQLTYKQPQFIVDKQKRLTHFRGSRLRARSVYLAAIPLLIIAAIGITIWVKAHHAPTQPKAANITQIQASPSSATNSNVMQNSIATSVRGSDFSSSPLVPAKSGAEVNNS
jgi:cytoskeleton protein RodZ